MTQEEQSQGVVPKPTWAEILALWRELLADMQSLGWTVINDGQWDHRWVEVKTDTGQEGLFTYSHIGLTRACGFYRTHTGKRWSKVLEAYRGLSE